MTTEQIKSLASNLDGQITVRDMVAIMGGRIEHYPVIGNTIIINGNRHCERDLSDDGNVAISYEWTCKEGGDMVTDGNLCRIYIGHRLSGPMLQCDVSGGDDGRTTKWRNCYSKGNFGKNFACGGNWSGNRKTYATASDSLNGRDYDVNLGRPHEKAYTESLLLLSEVRDFVGQFE